MTAKKSEQPVVCYIHARPDTPGARQGSTASAIRTISIEDHQQESTVKFLLAETKP